MDDDIPAAWEREVHETRTAEFVDYLHASGDVRVRITPPENTDDGAYAVGATLFPHTSLAETYDVRTVASGRRAERIAQDFAALFAGGYGGPGGNGTGEMAVEDAVAYALERTRPTDAVGTKVPSRDE